MYPKGFLQLEVKMDKGFSSEYMIYYSGLKPDLSVKFIKLMELMQETSIMHTDSTKYPMKWYSENNFGFVLTNWQVKVSAYPSVYDRIRVTTWPIMFKGILAERMFKAVNEKNELIALANTKWAYSDLIKRRPVKPAHEIIESYGTAYGSLMETDYTFPSVDGYEKISENCLTVTRRDLDSNFHVNNIKYIEWAFDYIPDETYDSLNITDMKVMYKKECVRGDRILIETYRGRDNAYITLIKPADNPEALHAGIYGVWNYL